MKLRRWLSAYAIFVALAVEFLLVSATTDTFFTEANLSNVLRQNTFTAILAAGMTFVILTGGIDLSVGSVVGLSGVICADMLAKGHGLAPAIAAGLLVGVLVGIVNGLAVTQLRVPAFVVTLAMMLIVRGAAFKYTDARTITGLPAQFAILSDGATAAVIMAGIFGLSWLALMRSALGRHVYAIGGNLQAAWLAGVRVPRTQLVVYAICGFCAGLAGVLVASRLSAGYPRAGELLRARCRRCRRCRRYQPLRRKGLHLGHARRRVLHRNPEQRPEPVSREHLRPADRQRRGPAGCNLAGPMARALVGSPTDRYGLTNTNLG